jgi:hypothetical protein
MTVRWSIARATFSAEGADRPPGAGFLEAREHHLLDHDEAIRVPARAVANGLHGCAGSIPGASAALRSRRPAGSYRASLSASRSHGRAS